MACSVVAAAHAAQVVIDVQFARDNDIIISAAVLDIEDLAPTRSAPGQDGVISVSRDCKAQVEIKSILKDMTGLLVQGDTVSVVYSCGAWLERATLIGNVDPENTWHNVSIGVMGIDNIRIRFRIP